MSPAGPKDIGMLSRMDPPDSKKDVRSVLRAGRRPAGSSTMAVSAVISVSMRISFKLCF
jgi:hypothetical protein